MPTTSIPAAKPRAGVAKTLVGTGAGNAVEWYDWAVYATFASFISGQLFSSGHSCDRYAMRFVSGNHFGAITPVGTLVTRRASPPSLQSARFPGEVQP